jgi:hypothetical protein
VGFSIIFAEVKKIADNCYTYNSTVRPKGYAKTHARILYDNHENYFVLLYFIQYCVMHFVSSRYMQINVY